MTADGYALVVGAASGIGLETALTFAERGVRGLAIADKNAAGAAEAAEKAQKVATAENFQVLAVTVDVADRKSVKSMIDEVKQKFGRIDYAVNSAGIPRRKEAYLGQIDAQEFEDLYEVNCKGILHCLQEEIEVMKSQEPKYVEGRSGKRSVGPGSIICVTSLSSLIGSPKSITYTASKFGARAIIKCAALENRGSGLRINEVCPGFTDTPMLRNGLNDDPKLTALINKSMPLGRVATPEEIAGVVHFLATPSASFINGETIVVDSGVSVSTHR